MGFVMDLLFSSEVRRHGSTSSRAALRLLKPYTAWTSGHLDRWKHYDIGLE